MTEGVCSSEQIPSSLVAPQSTLKVLFFPGGEQKNCIASDRGGEENMVGTVIRKNHNLISLQRSL